MAEDGKALMKKTSTVRSKGGRSSVYTDYFTVSGKGVAGPSPNCTCMWGLVKVNNVYSCPRCGEQALV